ncbi:glycosyltransferase family 4 protein [Butyrivibrio sp. VCB2006]|uniref:glycosyltransferase family 4 protein n=1 Tax=Butyrivibrio sp. VCB2006 TaxID=1280679 RepID=UPI0004924AC9|nr:glycosyltransferase family 4 protein [Butyrivibrio sp. VCB2006]
MKILIISHEYPPVGGGGANACMNLAREYAKEGNEVHIVTVWYEGQQEKEILSYESNVYIYRLKSKRKHLDHCSFKEMMDYLVKALPVADKLQKKEKFDVCQIFFGIPSGPIGYYLKKKYKLPYIIRFGGGDIPGFQDRFTKVYKLIGPAIKTIWKNADALVANSKGLKELALNFYDKQEILIIPNGADINAFSDVSTNNTQSHKIDDNTINLLFVSRLIERKGLQDILPQLQAINDNCRKHGENNKNSKTIKLRIVGDGPYRETLEEIVKNCNIENIVSFEGQKSKEELSEYYSNADIFVFPSRKEGMPNVVLEAMSYGLPIIMTPCQGSDELINGNGYVVKANEFADKITELSTNDEKRIAMGNRSKTLVAEEFSWKKTADAYRKVFDEICS